MLQQFVLTLTEATLEAKLVQWIISNDDAELPIHAQYVNCLLDNLPTNQLTISQVVDWSTFTLDNSQTSQLADRKLLFTITLAS